MSCQDCREVSRFILLGLTILGWIFSIVAVANCAFVKVGVDSYYSGSSSGSIGLFKVGADGTCVKYSATNITLSTAFKVARAFGVLCTLSVSFAMILVAVVVLVYPNRIMWNVYRVLVSFAFVFNMLQFSAFADPACVDYMDKYGNISYRNCSVGAASVCAILNAWLLLATSIMSCIVPTPKEPLFKNLSCGNVSFTNANTESTTTRTVEETPDGKKITEKVTDSNGNVTVTTTFEPLDDSPAVEGFNVGPTVKTSVEELPNGSKVIEEDAQGNKTVTTKVVIMAGDTTPSTETYDDDSDVVMAAAVPVSRSRQAYQSDDEERGIANPYLSSKQDTRWSNQNQHGTRTTQASESYSRNDGNQYASASESRGRPDSGIDNLAPPPQHGGHYEDSASSSFRDSGNFDDSFMASSGNFDDSFMDSSGNFDSFTPGDSVALDGTGERKPKKKKKKKHHKSSSRHRDGEYRESRKRREEQPEPVSGNVQGGG